ncbi:hypothetical protein ABT336_05935 [Micromonospora sp. NPDC000207]
MTTNGQTDNAPRDRHRIIVEYLKTVPGVFRSAALLLGAVTAFVVTLAR